MKKLFYLGVLITLLLAFPSSSYAFSLNDIRSAIHSAVSSITHPTPTPQPSGKLMVKSEIKLAKDGDINGNGIVDGGDIVEFQYIISNLSDSDYPYAVLKTNIPRKNLYFLNNIQGAFSMSDTGSTITFPNLYIHAHQVLTITFDAHILFSGTDDPILTTQAQIFSKDNKKINEDTEKKLQTKHVDFKKVPFLLNKKQNI